MKLFKSALFGLFFVLFGVVLAVQVPTRAFAKDNCLEGRTSSGKCIKPFVAAFLRKNMIAFTQPNISKSSKLISTIAAPAQIIAGLQNLSVAQSSYSTFDILRGLSQLRPLLPPVLPPVPPQFGQFPGNGS